MGAHNPNLQSNLTARELRDQAQYHHESRREAELALAQFDAILEVVAKARDGQHHPGHAVDRIADLAEVGQRLTFEAGERYEQFYHTAMDEAVQLEGKNN